MNLIPQFRLRRIVTKLSQGFQQKTRLLCKLWAKFSDPHLPQHTFETVAAFEGSGGVIEAKTLFSSFTIFIICKLVVGSLVSRRFGH